MTTFYAIFKTTRGARRASQGLHQYLDSDGEVQVIDKPERLSHHVVPLGMTEAGRGALLGGAWIAALTVVVVGLALVGLDSYGVDLLLPPGPTLALSFVLGGTLGGLSGGLAFASDSKVPVQRLRDQLRRKRPILLVSGSRDLGRVLERFEPMQVGVLVS